MIHTRELTILLVSDDAELCAAARREFEAKEGGLRVAAVRTVDAARRIVEDTAPTVILLEKTSAIPESEGCVAKMPRLNSVVSALAVRAPAVVCPLRWRWSSGACARRSKWPATRNSSLPRRMP